MAGILDYLKRVGSPVAPVATPASGQPPMIGQGTKNALGIIDRVLGGQTITDAMNSQKQVQAQRAMAPAIAEQKQKSMNMLEALHNSGQINDLAYYQAINDPASFGKISVNQLEPKVVSPSGSVFSNGQLMQAAATPEKPQQPEVIKGDDGLYLYDPATQKSRKLASWQQFAPRAAKSSGGGSGASDAPPFGFVLD